MNALTGLRKTGKVIAVEGIRVYDDGDQIIIGQAIKVAVTIDYIGKKYNSEEQEAKTHEHMTLLYVPMGERAPSIDEEIVVAWTLGDIDPTDVMDEDILINEDA